MVLCGLGRVRQPKGVGRVSHRGGQWQLKGKARKEAVGKWKGGGRKKVVQGDKRGSKVANEGGKQDQARRTNREGSGNRVALGANSSRGG